MYTATITSKRQFTIPADLFKILNFEVGQKVVVSAESESMKIQSAALLVEKLAGSVGVPARFKGRSVDRIIKLAREEHFNHKAKA